MRRIRTVDRTRRRGATTVELAVVLPVFFMFVFAMIEFSHAVFVMSVLNAAAKKAARLGVGDNTSTADVETKVTTILAAAIPVDNLTVQVKDAGSFDAGEVDPTSIDYDALPSIELSDAEPRKLFIVRVQIPYEDVALIPPFWITGVTLSGQSVMRHE